MFRRLTKEESGLALPLAIGVMVIVGVMGAGLLVFVNRDLESVIEVNRGQKAFEIAEAGVASARQQQLSDVVRRHYDRDRTNDCFDGQIRATDEDWSPNTTIYSNPKDCSSTTTTRARRGVTRNFAGGAFNVTIECFNQKNDNATNDPCAGAAIENAPEDIEASKRAYFKVTSTGYFPADGSGAVRTVQSIIHTNKLDVPTAYYTPKNIEFNGSPNVKGVSFFAGGNIDLKSADVDRATPALYNDWDTTNTANFTPTSKLNTVPRRSGPNLSDPKLTAAGFGAQGIICKNNCSGPSDSIADGKYDYDSTTSSKGSLKKFVRKSDADIASGAGNASGTITYPFNPNAKFDLDLLKNIARSQQNYYEGEIDIVDTRFAVSTANKQYPNCSSDLTVFYVKANGKNIDYSANYEKASVPSGCPTRAKGLIVVENGDFDINNSSNGFDGIVIVKKDPNNPASTTGVYTNSGNKTVEGFVIADNQMTIGGTADPFAVVGDYVQRPGFYNMKQWSWRECYSKDCS